ncbi:DUF2188 domain-containing protein [Ancylobacter lacus]|uniref:DUF2188 domain-containing protein n=1 Tax=Ancylobacter lacus TaxID=2579970 RepID=UPI001BCECCFB|nr:DUF2188 domain-containing protein [Ancylobacter lacus]MBS7539588.1 DUF2188 domain-containing protein [Ancylobacter lacus]
MQSEIYEVIGREGEWIVSHGGSDGMGYATKEAAFEAAVAAASNAIKTGAEVSIVVQGAERGESALGNALDELS